MDELLHALADNMLWTVGGTIAIVAIITSAIKDVIRTSKREASRREIAAYIAEGSMTPEQGERLMRSGPDSDNA